MMLQSFNPWQELEDLQRRLNRTLEKQGDKQGTWLPATDVVEDSESLHVYIDLPDIDRDSLEVSSEQNTLSVKAQRHYPQTEGQTVHHQGRPQGAFVRNLSVSSSFDLSKVEASYKDGVLSVVIPRSENTKPRKINVNIAD